MKTRFLFVGGALLVAMAGSAIAQESQQEMQSQAQSRAQSQAQLQVRPTGQAGVVHDANTSAQATSDTSYGGAADTRSATSNMSRPRQCVGGSVQCDVFFGH